MTPHAPQPAPAPAPALAPTPATLADQKADFTAEGAPPPGKVATTPPVTLSSTPVAAAPVVHKLKSGPKRKASKHRQAG